MISHYIIILLAVTCPSYPRRSRKSNNDEFGDAISNDFTGMFIWRIEDFSPVPIPKESYGSFHIEDSYVVLQSKMHEGRLHRGTIFSFCFKNILNLKYSKIFTTGSGTRPQ